jgi:hypothetical protein
MVRVVVLRGLVRVEVDVDGLLVALRLRGHPPTGRVALARGVGGAQAGGVDRSAPDEMLLRWLRSHLTSQFVTLPLVDVAGILTTPG